MKDDEVALLFDESTDTFNIRHKKIEIDIKQKDFKDGLYNFIKKEYKGVSVTDEIFEIGVDLYVEKLIKDSK